MNMLAPKEAEIHEDQETQASFIAAMASAVTPVSIVTTDGSAGRFGMTVSAVTSLSADPPMVLACINQKSPALDAIKNNGVFCINMLSVDQDALANCFAGRPGSGEPYNFNAAEWQSLVSGSPALCAAAAVFDCTLAESRDAGTHTIIIGRVMGVQHTTEPPLAYTDRTYRALQPTPLQQDKGS